MRSPALALLASALLLLAPPGPAAARGPVAEDAYRAAFSAERLGSPPPSAQLATEFTMAYRGALPHAAFAVARDAATGRSAWGWVSAQPSAAAAETVALERCRRALGTLQAECRILAVDGAVDGAPPVAPVTGTIGPFRWSPLHLRHGPEQARGVLVWGHGYGGPDRDNRNRALPGITSVLNDAGWDVLRFDRHPGDDTLSGSLARLSRGLPELRAAGYRQVVLAGQSRGGWQAIMAAADNPGLVQAVIATAPAAHGEAGRPNNLGAALDDFRRLLAGLPSPTPRLLVALFDGDDYDPDPERRAVVVEALGRERAAPTLVLWPQQEIRGHNAVGDWRFTRLFGGCVLTLVQAPEAAAPRGMRRAPCGGG